MAPLSVLFDGAILGRSHAATGPQNQPRRSRIRWILFLLMILSYLVILTSLRAFFTKNDCGLTLLLSLTVPLLLRRTLFRPNLLIQDTGYELKSILNVMLTITLTEWDFW